MVITDVTWAFRLGHLVADGDKGTALAMLGGLGAGASCGDASGSPCVWNVATAFCWNESLACSVLSTSLSFEAGLDWQDVLGSVMLDSLDNRSANNKETIRRHCTQEI